MSDELHVSSSTDTKATVAAVASGEDGRATVDESSLSDFTQSADGRTVTYENPQSERQSLLERLAEAEQEVIELPVEKPDTETSPTEESRPPVDESKLGFDIDSEARRVAIQDAIEDSRRRFRQPYQEAEQIREQMAVAFATRFDEIKPPDIEKLVKDAAKEGTDVSVAVRDALLGLRGGPEAMLHLLQHPEMRRQLAREDDYVAVARVGELAGRLAGPPRRAISAAPLPISPVGGSATRSSVPPDEMSFADYSKWRERQIKSRRR